MNAMIAWLAALMLCAASGAPLFADEPAGKATPDRPGLVESALKACEAKDFQKAISLWKEILAAGPHPVIEYNLACAYAQSGDSNNALLHLEKAVDLGFIDVGHMEKDPDLLTIRNASPYAKILQKARTAAEAEQKTLAAVPAPQDIVLPANGLKQGEKSPLLVFLHGMGSSPADLKPVFEPLTTSLNYTVFLPSGSVKLRMRRDGKPGYNWDAHGDAQALIEKVRKMDGVDPRQIYLGGFSAGANMAYIVVLDAPELFAGVIAFGGAVQPAARHAEKTRKASGRVPLYIVHGTQDAIMPISLGREALDHFKTNNFRVTLKEFEGGHTLPGNYGDVIREAIRWFHAGPQPKEG